MGEPRWSEEATHESRATSQGRVLLLCSEPDYARIELSRPQLELAGTQVDVECALHDPRAVRAAVADAAPSTLVAVVVSADFERERARPALDAISTTPGAGLRMLVLDLRRHPSAARQCRAVSRALEGLRRTVEIDGTYRGLSTSATRCASVGGEISVSERAAGAAALRVVHPPLLLQRPLNERAEVIPSAYRIDVPRRVRCRPTAETRPEIAANGLPQPYAT